MVHQTLNLKILMNRIPLSFPIGATWRLLGSLELNPRKQPEEPAVDFPVVMFGGTSERMTWPLAVKFEPSRVISGLAEPLILSDDSELRLLKLGGAIGDERKTYRDREREY